MQVNSGTTVVGGRLHTTRLLHFSAATRVVRPTITPVCSIKADRPWTAWPRKAPKGTTARRPDNLRLPHRWEDLPGDVGDVKS